MVVFLLISLLALLLPDLYLWLTFVRGSVPLAWSLAWWLPTALALATLGAAATGYYADWLIKLFFVILLCAALPKLLFAVVSLAGRGIGTFVPGVIPTANIVGLLLAAVVCTACIYGFTRGWKRLEVRETKLAFRNLPAAFDGYRIVQISDLHVGTFGRDSRFLRKLTRRVESLQPDVIVFTGDLVNTSPDELDPFMETLAQLHAPDGVYSILGNHDYCTYRRYDTPGGAARSLGELKRREAALGWELLADEHRTLRRGVDSIFLIGVENVSRPPFPARGDLQRAAEGIPENGFRILLSHDPSHWRLEVLPDTEIELTLAGHTHAMQLRIMGLSPAKWSYPEWGGLYREGERMLHVSTGAGGNVGFRLGAWPAVNLLVLHRTDN